ncbi:MAG: HRDC domain-containing protein, partial [Novosphingobium sp.]
PKAERNRKARRDRPGGVNPAGDPLFEALRALRRDLAAEAGLPPYVIFHDSTLREMAERRPAALSALGELGGVGARKLEAYGEAFLAVIRQF